MGSRRGSERATNHRDLSSPGDPARRFRDPISWSWRPTASAATNHRRDRDRTPCDRESFDSHREHFDGHSTTSRSESNETPSYSSDSHWDRDDRDAFLIHLDDLSKISRGSVEITSSSCVHFDSSRWTRRRDRMIASSYIAHSRTGRTHSRWTRTNLRTDRTNFE